MHKKYLALFWVLFICIVFLIAVYSPVNNQDTKRLDTCIDTANEAGIDPNDDQRSEFIMNCYETNEEK